MHHDTDGRLQIQHYVSPISNWRASRRNMATPSRLPICGSLPATLPLRRWADRISALQPDAATKRSRVCVQRTDDCPTRRAMASTFAPCSTGWASATKRSWCSSEAATFWDGATPKAVGTKGRGSITPVWCHLWMLFLVHFVGAIGVSLSPQYVT